MPSKSEHPICRFCCMLGKRDSMVNPSRRYFYHPDCYLAAGRKLDGLSDDQLSVFSIGTLREHCQLERALAVPPHTSGAAGEGGGGVIKFEELTNPKSCMSRARNDEMTFVLLGRDVAAPAAIRFWCAERIRLGKNAADDPQILEALACVETMAKERTP